MTRRLTNQKIPLYAASLILLISVIWNSQEPEEILPKLVGVIPFFILLFYITIRAAAWIIALLTIGHTFFKGSLALFGDSTRTDLAALPYVAVGGVVGLVVLSRLSKNDDSVNSPGWSFSAKVIFGLNILIGLILAAGLQRSQLPEYGTSKVIGYLAFNNVPLFLILYFIRSIGELKSLVVAVAILGTLSAIATEIYMIVIHGSIFGWGGMFRFNQENFYGLQIYGGVWFARRVGFGLISALMLAFFLKKKLYFIAASIAIAFDWFIVFMAGRGPAISITVSIALFIVMIVMAGRIQNIARMGLLIAPAAIVVLIFISGNIEMPEGVLDRYNAFENYEEYEQRENRYRFLFYENALEVFLENPIFGVGTGGWRANYDGPDQSDGDNLYPHNIFLELGAENGLVGLVPFIMLAGVAFYVAFRHFFSSANPEVKLYATWCCVLLTQAFVNALISGDIFHNELLWFSFAIVGSLDTGLALKYPQNTQASIHAPLLRFALPGKIANSNIRR